jgi:hypothetical protein
MGTTGDANEINMEVRFTEAACLAIGLHTLHYEDSFIELFHDSGPWNEEMILTSQTTLDPIEGIAPNALAAGQNYLTIMRSNLANLKVALVCK